MFHRRSALTILIVALLGACSKGAPAVARGGDVPVTFEFDQKGSIVEGDAVTLRGFEIGRVTKVSLARKVRVDTLVQAEHARLIPSCAYGFATADWAGTGTIEVVVVDDAAPPLAKGQPLAGTTTTAGRIALESRLRLTRAVARAKEELSGGRVEAGLAEAERLASEGVDAARSGLEQLDESARGGVRDGLARARTELQAASEDLGAAAKDAWHGTKRLAGDAAAEAKRGLGGAGAMLQEGGAIAAKGARAIVEGARSIDLDGALGTAKKEGAQLYEDGAEAVRRLLEE